MTSASKRKGSVKTVEWCKHLRPEGKKRQNRIVREDGKKQCNQTELEFIDGDSLSIGELCIPSEMEE